MGKTITLTIVETTHYGGQFELEELEEIAGVTVADEYEGDLDQFLEDFRENIYLTSQGEAWQEELEHKSGDVQGQSWDWEYEPDPPVRPCVECGEETDGEPNEPGYTFRNGTVMCQSCTHNAFRSGWGGESGDE